MRFYLSNQGGAASHRHVNQAYLPEVMVQIRTALKGQLLGALVWKEDEVLALHVLGHEHEGEAVAVVKIQWSSAGVVIGRNIQQIWNKLALLTVQRTGLGN